MLCGLYHGLCVPPELDLLFRSKFDEKFRQRSKSSVNEINNKQNINTSINQNDNNSNNNGIFLLNAATSMKSGSNSLHNQMESNIANGDNSQQPTAAMLEEHFFDILKEVFEKSSNSHETPHIYK